MKKYIITLDIGTTSVRASLWNAHERTIVGNIAKKVDIFFPEIDCVEQDAYGIYRTVVECTENLVQGAGAKASEIYGLGITNQRETVVVWDKKSGRPLAPAISWQDRRTMSICTQFEPNENLIRNRTGLIMDPYFSATKFKWLFDNVPYLRSGAENGEVLCGTLDSFIVWQLTERRMHLTDMSNASRTMLFNINMLKWCDVLMKMFDIPKNTLPVIAESIGFFGEAAFRFGKVPIISVMGDQQSALFGQACFDEGDAKHTYGTGGFLLANIGDTPYISDNNLLTTVAWFFNGKVSYALEGSIFNAGSVIQWIRDELKLIATTAECETCAMSVEDNGGVYFVPAFGGLGAPYWDNGATGNISGINRGTTREHIVRAAVEGMAYSVSDLIHVFAQDDVHIKSLKVDGGAAVNNFLLQFQADILNRDLIRPKNMESTAQGAFFAAAFGAGVFNSLKDITIETDRVFSPTMKENVRKKMLHGWSEAIEKSRLKNELIKSNDNSMMISQGEGMIDEI